MPLAGTPPRRTDRQSNAAGFQPSPNARSLKPPPASWRSADRSRRPRTGCARNATAPNDSTMRNQLWLGGRPVQRSGVGAPKPPPTPDAPLLHPQGAAPGKTAAKTAPRRKKSKSKRKEGIRTFHLPMGNCTYCLFARFQTV